LARKGDQVQSRTSLLSSWEQFLAEQLRQSPEGAKQGGAVWSEAQGLTASIVERIENPRGQRAGQGRRKALAF